MNDPSAHISQVWRDHVEAGHDPDQVAREEGHSVVRAVIVRMARTAGEEVREQPITPGSACTTERPNPAAGIRFALMLRASAEAEVSQYITRARVEGLTWTQIGEILDPALWGIGTNGSAFDLAERAFEYATDAEHHDRFDTLTFYWTCPACGATVSDQGPYDSHPADNEHNHAEGCTRLAAAVTAYEAHWSDE